MSCQSNSERGVEAGIKNGISRLACKTGNVIGVIQSGYTKTADLYSDQVTCRMAPVTNSILSRVDRPSSKAAAITSGVVNSEVFPMAVTAAMMLAPGLGIRIDEKAVRAVIKAKNDVGFAFGASKLLASMAAGLTREGQGKVLTLKRGEKEIMSVSFVKSPKFSQFLNRLDLIGSSKQDENIISSSGDIVRAGLKAGEPKARRIKAALKLGGAVLTEVALEGIHKADVELQKLKVETPAIQSKIIKRVVVHEEQLPNWPYRRQVEQIIPSFEKVLVCPDCGAILVNELGEPLKSIEEMGDQKQQCHAFIEQKGRECGAPLWQRIPYQYGGRVAIADFLNKHYAGRYDLILDEAHNLKGGSTDAGYASGDLVMAARRILELSGTYFNGVGSGIFYLLFRLSPEFRAKYSYTEVQRFVNHNGLRETITKLTLTRDPYSSAYGYTRESKTVRELPGATPGIVMALLPLAVFIKLHHISSNLPEYRELRMPVILDDRFKAGIGQIESIHKDAVEFSRKGKPGLMSAWLYASLGWMDCPVDETLTAIDHKTGKMLRTYKIDGILSHPDEIPDLLLPKDQALLDLIQHELSRGRGVGVFFAQVNRRDWMSRIQNLLAKHGIYSEILRRSTCKPNERERWYREFVQRCQARGQRPVLLTNGNLLKEGLDLLELCTIVETGIEFRLSYLRQRIRRSLRITQEKNVKVVFLFYTDSYQEVALKVIAVKLKAVMLVDGDLVAGLAEMDIDGDNLMDALIEAITVKAQGIDKGWSGMSVAHLTDPDSPEFLPPSTNGHGMPSDEPTFEEVFRES